MEKPTNLALAYSMKRRSKKMPGTMQPASDKMPKLMAEGGAACSDCASMGGKCMAHGGSVSPSMATDKHDHTEPLDTMGEEQVEAEGQRMAKGGDVHQPKMPPSPEMPVVEEGSNPSEDYEAPDPHRPHYLGTDEERRLRSSSTTAGPDPKMYAEGGIVDSIMTDRKKPAHVEAPESDPDVEPAMAEKMDYSAYHEIPDEAHDDLPATDDESLVGQILRDRKSRRHRGM